jgi:hypothetical protein
VVSNGGKYSSESAQKFVERRQHSRFALSAHGFGGVVSVSKSSYWVNIGNNAETGQFVLGQPENRHNQNAESRLPTVAALFPEIINPKLDNRDRLPSCSAVEALERPNPLTASTALIGLSAIRSQPNQLP